MTVLFALDIDGVLNAVGDAARPAPVRATGWSMWTRRTVTDPGDGSAFPILMADTVRVFIREMHTDPRVDLRLLSTWMHHPDAWHNLRDAFELPDLGFLADPSEMDQTDPWRWWKHIALERFPADRPLVWADDDIRRNWKARTWVNDRPGPTLTITPNTGMGLLPTHLNKIRAFVADHGTPED